MSNTDNSNQGYAIFSAANNNYVPSGTSDAASAWEIFDLSLRKPLDAESNGNVSPNDAVWDKFDETSGHGQDQLDDSNVWDKFDEM